jgi:hypothetical protein
MLKYCLTQLILSAISGENSIHITSYPLAVRLRLACLVFVPLSPCACRGEVMIIFQVY